MRRDQVALLSVGWLLGSSLWQVAQAQPDKVLYELQERCGKQAAQTFAKDYGNGFSNVSGTQYIYSFRNHYHARLNKCFYLVATRIWITAQGKREELTTLELFDLNENYRFGMYIGRPDDPMPPTTCEMRLKECRSNGEWLALASPYMDE